MVDTDKVNALNEKVYEKGLVDREHLQEFLTFIETEDPKEIIREVKEWLTVLHQDSHFDKVTFPPGDIEATISNLDSYGRVKPEDLYEYRQNSSRVVPIS